MNNEEFWILTDVEKRSMMAKQHKCEWYAIGNYSGGGDGAMCNGCKKELSYEEVNRRLNVTDLIVANLRTLTHRDLENGVHEQLADILEGK